ncbi:MAG: hypothetical protein K6G63_02050, partial [Eubacterium sp.]|nr:hypothetical protein [Eubacterium sp.]
MKKDIFRFINKNIIWRLCSLALSLVLLVFGIYAFDIVVKRSTDKFENERVKAAEYNVDAAYFQGSNLSLTSETFKEFSRAYAGDSSFANAHKNDDITITVTGELVLESDFESLGTSDSPFNGNIYFTAVESTSQTIVEDKPLFNYVTDKVGVFKSGTSTVFDLEFIRSKDVDSDENSPLFAIHVVHDSTENRNAAKWVVILSNRKVQEFENIHSYSGVISTIHEGSQVQVSFTDKSTYKITHDDIIANGGVWVTSSDTNVGTICGKIEGDAKLDITYMNENADTYNYIQGNGSVGGLVGKVINNSSGNPEITISSYDYANFYIENESKSGNSGFIAGTVTGEGGGVTINLPEAIQLTGEIAGNTLNAGGLIGSLVKGDINVTGDETNAFIYDKCVISGNGAAGGAIGYFAPLSQNNKIINTLYMDFTNCEIKGGKKGAGGVIGEYVAVGGENIDLSNRYSFNSETTISAGDFGGGIFGQYDAKNTSNISGSLWYSPSCAVSYGGIIGKYYSDNIAHKLVVDNLDVETIKYAPNSSDADSRNDAVGGVIGFLEGSCYIEAGSIDIKDASVVDLGSKSLFGGIVGKSEGANNKGSFLNVLGDVTIDVDSCRGGGIAGTFKNGVVRLSGELNLRDANVILGYSHLIFQNDNSLIYALGNGKDSNWSINRNVKYAVSDLGDNGEVIRLFSSGNAEAAGIVTFDATNHKVELAAPVLNVTSEEDFAKLALNMQLNDGIDKGVLGFADTNNTRNKLLKENITVSGKIDLSGTGIVSLTRDGGCLYRTGFSNNLASNNTDDRVFTGTIKGITADAEIVLAAGEPYGTVAGKSYTGASASDANKNLSGALYASYSNSLTDHAIASGHRLVGLVAVADNASFENFKISGCIRGGYNIGGGNDGNDVSSCIGPLIGYAGGNNNIKNIDVDGINIYQEHGKNNSYDRYYIGGIAGIISGPQGGTTLVDTCNINANIKLAGSQVSNYNRLRLGGLAGALEGGNVGFTLNVENSKFSPSVTGVNTSNNDYCYIAGMIGDIPSQSTYRKVNITDTEILDASLQNGSTNPGGFLGTSWLHTDVSIDNLSIKGSKIESKSGSTKKIGGLMLMGSGRWDIDGLKFENNGDKKTTITTTNESITSVGLIVSEAYYNNDAMYINLKNSSYQIDEDIVIPEVGYVDEIAADSAPNPETVLTGGNNTGVISINMNASDNGSTKVNETGTYQNKYFKNSIPNSHARYYYNLDEMAKEGHTKTDGEKFLLNTVNIYCASNIKKYFSGTFSGLTDVDLSGLSYYPIDVTSSDIQLPAAVYTLGYDGIIAAEEDSGFDTDEYKRNPNDTDNKRNQHYLMQSGLFRNVTKTISQAGSISLKGSYGYVSGAMSGAVVGGTLTGTFDITQGITFNGIKPSDSDAALMLNTIDGIGTNVPVVKISKVRLSGYGSESLPIASALINRAEGVGMDIKFSDIKMDARDGASISDDSWGDSAANAMTNAYGTSRSIFKNASFFNALSADTTSRVEYNYSWEEDWGNSSERNVTYAKEITDTIIYRDEDDDTKSGENKYLDSNRWYTNPIDSSQRSEEFSFSKGFLPHVAGKASDDTTTYPIYEVKVNFIASGLDSGCGTYNDPYIINSAAKLTKVANYINSDSGMLSVVRLPNELNATWHSSEKKDCLYEKNEDTYSPMEDGGLTSDWNKTSVRKYLAGAYYMITEDIALKESYPGIGIGGTGESGEHIFHGVIVGRKSDGSKPIITNPTGNPLIKISNGAVVKNVDLRCTKSTIDLSLGTVKSGGRFGYGRVSDEKAVYYGGIIGEIMGGDNIIDNVNVNYTGQASLSGGKGNTIPVGGYVGVIVNGGLIFRNITGLSEYNATGLTVKNGNTALMDDSVNRAVYVNPIVGRVINGYAVNEGAQSINNGTKHYTIDKLNKNNTNKLSVSLSDESINIPDAQALFVMSLITQSTAGVANSQDGSYNQKSFSYGVATNSFLVGVNHLGD